jgi:hypothetical protein
MSGDVLGPAADVWGSRDREFKVAECQAEAAGVEVGVVAADRTVPRVAGGGAGRKAEADAPGKFGHCQAPVLLHFTNGRHRGVKAWLPILIDGSVPNT